MISILIPSYGRPDRIKAVVENASANTTYSHEIIVIVEESEYHAYADNLSPTACRVLVNQRSKNYAGAMNTAIAHANGHHFFFAADDLNFHPQWDDEALKVMAALDTIMVVGTNDLLNGYVLAGLHATHYLVDRQYIWQTGGVVDGEKGHALFEGYTHNFTDTEFIGTAKARAVFAPCLSSIVEHNHFSVGKSAKDATYDKGYLDIQKDSDLYHERRHTWWDLSK